jgi:hypothetical protein
MKLLLALAVAGVTLLPSWSNAADGTTGTAANSGNTAIVVQSGGRKPAEVQIERRPGYTRIEQHSGNNSATIIQMDAPPEPH